MYAALAALASFLQKTHNIGNDGGKFKLELLSAIFLYLQPATLALAQEIPLPQGNGTFVCAGDDNEFQQRLHAKLYQLISESGDVQALIQLLHSIPKNLLTIDLLDRALSVSASSSFLPDLVNILVPFTQLPELRDKIPENAIFEYFNRALGQSRSLPPTEFLQAVDSLLSLRLFPTDQVLDLGRSFLHGMKSPHKALSWLCTQRQRKFDSDLELMLEKMAKDVMSAHLLETVGGIHAALKHMKRIIALPSVNALLALDIIRYLCDRGLPQLSTLDALLANARLWRKFTQVMNQAMNHHNLVASKILTNQLSVLDKLRQSVAYLGKGLSSKELTLHDIAQLSANRRPFIKLCQVISHLG